MQLVQDHILNLIPLDHRFSSLKHVFHESRPQISAGPLRGFAVLDHMTQIIRQALQRLN